MITNSAAAAGDDCQLIYTWQLHGRIEEEAEPSTEVGKCVL